MSVRGDRFPNQFCEDTNLLATRTGGKVCVVVVAGCGK